MSEIDVKALTKLTFLARQDSALHREMKLLENWFESLKQADNLVMLDAYDETSEEIFGWMIVHIGLPEIGFILDWNPVVPQNKKQEKIALALVEYSKTLVDTHSLSRLEFWVSPSSKALKEIAATITKWYDACGFRLVENEIMMEANLTDLAFEQASFSSEIEVVSMSVVPNEELIGPVLETLQDGEGGWLTGQTRTQQEVNFHNWFNREEPFDSDASIILKKDGLVIGFIVVRVEDDVADIGPLGIVAEHQGKGLGKAIVGTSLKKLKEKGIRLATLEVSINNKVGIILYSHLGFQRRHHLLTYAWNHNWT